MRPGGHELAGTFDHERGETRDAGPESAELTLGIFTEIDGCFSEDEILTGPAGWIDENETRTARNFSGCEASADDDFAWIDV